MEVRVLKKNLKNTCAKALSVALALAMAASVSPASVADAAKKKAPKLSVTKATITVGKTKKVTVKNAKAKKVTWTVNKKGKKVVKLTKKSKKGVTIKAVKTGKATVTAKIKVGKKTYKKTVKVTVKAKKTPTPTKGTTATPVPSAGTNNQTPTPSAGTNNPTPTPSAGVADPTPTQDPGNDPGDDRPSYDPATSYKADFPEITISEYNEATVTYGDEGRGNLVWDETAHTLKATSLKNYNGGVALYLDPVKREGVDVSEYKYIAITYEAETEMYVKLFDSDITESKGHTYDQTVQKFSGTDSIKAGKHTVYVDITDQESEKLADIASIMVSAKFATDDAESADITIHSIKFTKTTNEDASKGEVAVSLDKAKAEVASGSSVELNATAATTGCAVKAYEWTVADEAVASVKGDGAKATVTGLKMGTTNVTVTVTTDTGITDKAVCALTVKDDALKPSADGSVTMTAANLYSSGCLVKAMNSTEEGGVTYNDDGSVTFISTNQYNGGGVAFYLNPDHSATDLSKYDKVEIVYASPSTADKTNDKIKVAFFTPAKPDNYMNSTSIKQENGNAAADYDTTLNGTEEQKATIDLTSDTWKLRGNAYAIAITFNAYGYGDYSTDDGKKWCTVTIKSIKLIKSEA